MFCSGFFFINAYVLIHFFFIIFISNHTYKCKYALFLISNSIFFQFIFTFFNCSFFVSTALLRALLAHMNTECMKSVSQWSSCVCASRKSERGCGWTNSLLGKIRSQNSLLHLLLPCSSLQVSRTILNEYLSSFFDNFVI